MGESFENIKSGLNKISYKVVEGENKTPRIDIGDRKYTPQEISAMVLQKMKKLPKIILELKSKKQLLLFLHISMIHKDKQQRRRVK